MLCHAVLCEGVTAFFRDLLLQDRWATPTAHIWIANVNAKYIFFRGNVKGLMIAIA